MKKAMALIFYITIALALTIISTGCSQNHEDSLSYEYATQISDYYSPIKPQYTAYSNEDAYTLVIDCTTEIAVTESWNCAYRYRQVLSLTLGADNVFVAGFAVKFPEDILPNNIYDITVKHMGNIDSIMALAIWDSITEAEALLFSSIHNAPILLVLELIDINGNIIGHSLTHSPIYNAITHECYSVELEGIEWQRVWSPTNASADISQYQLKEAASITLASNDIFLNTIVLLPDDMQADEIYSVDVKHVGDMNSILTLDVWDSITEVETLILQNSNAIPVYIVLEFADFNGYVLGHSLTHAPVSAHGTNIEWHTTEIDDIEQVKVWRRGNT